MKLPKGRHHHARRRAKERIGLKLNNKDLASIIKIIQNRRCQFLYSPKFRPSRSVYAVVYRGESLKVVYDREDKIIVTIMNKWMDDRS